MRCGRAMDPVSAAVPGTDGHVTGHRRVSGGAVEDGVDLAAERGGSEDDGDADQRGDQPVFDGRGAGAIGPGKRGSPARDSCLDGIPVAAFLVGGFDPFTDTDNLLRAS